MSTDATPSKPELSPLRCPTCSAAVPLGDGAVARCAYCSIEVAIPAQYIALRDAANTHGRDQLEVRRLYAEASRPPSTVVRALGAMGRGVAIGGLGIGALIIVATIIGVIIREDDLVTAAIAAVFMLALAIPAFLETTLHFVTSHSYDLMDAFGPFAGVLPGLVVWLLVVAPILIGRTCRGAIGAIARLQGRLTAVRPVQPGGPAMCRRCGAALDVPAGALGVQCTYCKTDNLVTVKRFAAIAAVSETKHLHHDIEDVYAAHASELAVARSQVKRDLRRWLLGLMIVFEVLYFPAHWALDHSFTMLHRPSSHHGSLFPDSDEGNATIARSDAAVELGFLYRCHASTLKCIHFYIALTKGDHVAFEAPQARELTFTLQRHQRLVLAVGAWDPWVSDASLAERAPYTGWYRVEIRAPSDTETVKTTLRWTVKP